MAYLKPELDDLVLVLDGALPRPGGEEGLPPRVVTAEPHLGHLRLEELFRAAKELLPRPRGAG